MQKKIAQRSNITTKQIDATKQKLQKDKNAGLPAEAVKASEIEIQQLESQLEMKKFEVEKADEMIKVAKRK